MDRRGVDVGRGESKAGVSTAVKQAQAIVIGANLKWVSTRDKDGSRYRTMISDPSYAGDDFGYEVARQYSSKRGTGKDFENITGVNMNVLINALQTIHPSANIEIKMIHHNRDKFHRVSATPAYNVWELKIKK